MIQTARYTLEMPIQTVAVRMAIFATLLDVQVPHSLRDVGRRVPVYLAPEDEVPCSDQ